MMDEGMSSPTTITFWGSFDWDDGDDTPGVVCGTCGYTLAVPAGIEVDFS